MVLENPDFPIKTTTGMFGDFPLPYLITSGIIGLDNCDMVSFHHQSTTLGILANKIGFLQSCGMPTNKQYFVQLFYFRVYLLPHWNVSICGLHEARSPITSWRICSTYINLYLIVCIILTPEKCVVLFRGCSKQGGDPALTRQSSKTQKHMRSEAATEMGGEASKWIYTMNTNKNNNKMHLPIVTQVLHSKQLPQRGVWTWNIFTKNPSEVLPFLWPPTTWMRI